jgi:hypothetical protein
LPEKTLLMRVAQLEKFSGRSFFCDEELKIQRFLSMIRVVCTPQGIGRSESLSNLSPRVYVMQVFDAIRL